MSIGLYSRPDDTPAVPNSLWQKPFVNRQLVRPPAVAAVALLSGGLDSCVALAEAVREHGSTVAVLHAGYGQRTAAREHRAAHEIADHYNLALRRDLDLTWLAEMGGSSLTDASQPIPGAEVGGVTSTYVPFRNTLFLAAGVAWAEVLGADAVYCGAHAPGSTYPDTQPAYFEALNELVRLGTPAATEIHVRVPLLERDKAGIVRRGVELDAPLALTWSCYERDDRPCGRCHSCHLRAEGFAAAGVPDPLDA